MIIKERKKSINLCKLEALSRRTPPEHKNKQLIDEKLRRELAGFHGEKAIDYYLTFLPEERYYIYHNLRLHANHGRYFQIDTLLISQYFIVIIEIKNIIGTLFFDETPGQLIRNLNGNEKAFQDPLAQVKLQQLQLQLWLKKFHFPSIPIHYLITISHPSTILKSSPQYKAFQQSVTHAVNLPIKILQFQNSTNEEIITKKDLKKLSRLLLKYDEPLNIDILEAYGITEEELIKGVHCPTCSKIPMLRKRGHWYCSFCLFAAKDAHVASVQDYALLLRLTVTNRQLRLFLDLPSSAVAKNILKTLSFKQVGERKSRYYEISIDS